MDTTMTNYRKGVLNGPGLAGWHDNFIRRKEVIEIKAKQELTLEFLSTDGDRFWQVIELSSMLN